MKTNVLDLMKTALLVAVGSLCINCSDDDPTPMAAWELEVNQLKEATFKYTDITVATNEGFVDVSGFVPNMGHHYLLPPRADATFKLTEPEILLYAPNANGMMEFMGVEYIVPVDDANNPGLPPEGFTGSVDTWEFNKERSQWQLHVWIVRENPDGLFEPHNHTVGTGN